VRPRTGACHKHHYTAARRGLYLLTPSIDSLASNQTNQPKGLVKKQITYAMTALFAMAVISIAAPPDKDAMMAKEKAAWQAFKDKKSDDFKKLLSTDFMGVYSEGVWNLQQEVDAMQKWDMKSFSFSDFKFVMPDVDTVLVVYKVKVEGTYEGKDVSGDYNAASVWNMKSGEWRASFHTDMKAEAAAQ
jgi:hypothetical protein